MINFFTHFLTYQIDKFKKELKFAIFKLCKKIVMRVSMKSIKTTTHPILDANKKKELVLSFFSDSFHIKTFVFGARYEKRRRRLRGGRSAEERERERERRSGWK